MTIQIGDKEILEDGEELRVDMFMMDNVAVGRPSAVPLSDAARGLIRHSPGYAILNDADRRKRIERLQARNARIADAWRSPMPEPKTSTSKVTDAALSPRDRRISRLVNAWKNP
jgi:hypothetical protein